ncbi:MAG: NAD-dependent epimerase/dehydratase family protein [Tannerella sp.]|jgi:nucleoside-diphosphate-sugar epimerase|nr:NAD-dependent epimerase/dehydratase family protein [Tannerella sp.]
MNLSEQPVLCTGKKQGKWKEGSGTKVLITGAGGFIGRFLVEEALRRGYEVWAGIRATSSRAHLPQDRVRFIELKYDDPPALTAQLATHVREHGAWQYVVHNAGLTKTVRRENFALVNAEYTRRVLEALEGAGCRPQKFLLMSSLSSYGAGDEKTRRPIAREDVRRPETAYGESKRLAEDYVERQTAIPWVILCPTGVYGPGERDYRMEIQSIRAGFDFAAGRAPQYLSFIYVKDLAEVVFRALENPAGRNCRYLVSDGKTYSDTEFARLVQQLTGRKHVLRLRLPLWVVFLCCLFSEGFGRLTGRAMTLNIDKYRILKRRNWTCDSEPLRRELGFSPAFDLRRGLEETLRHEF